MGGGGEVRCVYTDYLKKYEVTCWDIFTLSLLFYMFKFNLQQNIYEF